MRQKLKFAQSIVHDPDLLILDEPTAGLDPEEREQMLTRIQVLSQRAGKAVLVSTHILPDVREVCDNAVILVKGKVRLVQSLEILKQPSSAVYHVRFGGDHSAFRELARRGGVHSKIEENGAVTLDGLDGGNVHSIWSWARETGVTVRSLTPARNTLEQMFMDAVRDAGDAGSR